MAAGAIYPANSSSLLSMGNQTSALASLSIRTGPESKSPKDVIAISNEARQAHAAASLYESAGFSSTTSPGPACANPAPFEKVVAAVQYQQVQSLLETGTTAYRPGSVASAVG